MIDIHAHILWGLDDGAETREQSLAMLKIAADCGTTDIVATPHANGEYSYDEAVVRQRIEELSQTAGGRPRIHKGCDFHLSFENIQDAVEHPARYTIGSGCYLLVEFPDASLHGMTRALETLLNRGLTPIMTHPERHPALRRINAEFRQWIEMGCLVQITAQSLLGRFGKNAEESAWEMVRRRMAHFVASDAHDENDRTPRLDEAFEAISSRVGGDAAQSLFITNPQAVISGRPIQTARPLPQPGLWRRLLGG